jgi:hypothetical protein
VVPSAAVAAAVAAVEVTVVTAGKITRRRTKFTPRPATGTVAARVEAEAAAAAVEGGTARPTDGAPRTFQDPLDPETTTTVTLMGLPHAGGDGQRTTTTNSDFGNQFRLSVIDFGHRLINLVNCLDVQVRCRARKRQAHEYFY